eukprot:scaffold16367_cov43-Phaeocystis_antarctica.AAC.1
MILLLATWIVRAWLDARNRSLVYSNAQPHSSVTLYTLRCTYDPPLLLFDVSAVAIRKAKPASMLVIWVVTQSVARCNQVYPGDGGAVAACKAKLFSLRQFAFIRCERGGDTQGEACFNLHLFDVSAVVIRKAKPASIVSAVAIRKAKPASVVSAVAIRKAKPASMCNLVASIRCERGGDTQGEAYFNVSYLGSNSVSTSSTGAARGKASGRVQRRMHQVRPMQWERIAKREAKPAIKVE